MFKFVAICACLAVAAAKPDVILPYSTGLSPALAYSSVNGIYNTAPLVYSSPLGYPTTYGFSHLIKKRSVPLVSSYIASAPLATTYTAAAPLAYSAPWATTYSTPLISSPAVYSTHLIKKRSAPLIVPSSYITPTTYAAASPLVSTYSSFPSSIYSSPLAYSAGPLAYTQFIKK